MGRRWKYISRVIAAEEAEVGRENLYADRLAHFLIIKDERARGRSVVDISDSISVRVSKRIIAIPSSIINQQASAGAAQSSATKRFPSASSDDESKKADSSEDTRGAARQMAREAIALMHDGRWAEAEALLGRASKLVPAPKAADGPMPPLGCDKLSGMIIPVSCQ